MIGKFTNSHSHSTPPPKHIDYIPEWVWEYSRSHTTISDHHRWLTTLFGHDEAERIIFCFSD